MMTMKHKTYDFYLMVFTVAVLAIIGLVCLYGIGYYTYTNETMPDWTETALYGQYIDSMNQLIYPFVVLLLVALGLCIPKRIVPRQSSGIPAGHIHSGTGSGHGINHAGTGRADL